MRRLPSTDGVEVAVYDFGGSGGALLLVHPTSFLAAALAPLAAELRGHFHCWGADLRGHGLTSSPDGLAYVWSGFAEDVLAVVDGLGLNRPLAVGHSSGGAAVLLAEAERPATFQALWCYEPIVWPDPERARARAERLADGARRRRDRFPTRAEAYENFRSKPPFSMLSEEALRAYVEHGFADQEDGSVALRCRREVEAEIYLRAIEGDRFARLAEVACPVTVACGGATEAIKPDVGEQQVAALPQARLVVFDGLGHFGPLEDAPRVASCIRRDLARA
jgi:pimeloyl-ACP methyl ester carboxylesterase